MSREIGYNVWENKDGKLIRHPLSQEQYDRTWVCGRCDATYVWGYGCSWDYENKKYVEAVFNKEFDNYSLNVPDLEYSRILKYIDFKDFKNHIMEVVTEEYQTAAQAKSVARKHILELKGRIKEYQELQLRSTSDFVFDKFQEKIDDCREIVSEEQSYIDIDAEEDYGYSHAKAVEQMLKDIEKYLKDGFIVSTFFSD